MTIRSKLRLFLIAAAGAAGALAVPAASADVFRVCADPDNLPFSKADGPERGLYVELAELVGKRMGTPVEYVWWLTYNQRKALRNTILQDGCDAYFALPADADYKLRGLQRTHAFIDVSYAVVAAPAVKVTSLDDLKNKRIGVLHASPPHIMLSRKEGYATTSFRFQEEALDALTRGEIDTAILWGPSAGYENAKRFQGRWRVTPVAGEGLGGQMAVAVRRGKDTLAAGIDKALTELQPEINLLADKYGFPRSKPVLLSAAAGADAKKQVLARAHEVPGGFIRTSSTAAPLAAKPAAAFVVAQAAVPAATAPTAAATAATAGMPDLVAGRSRFNDVCSHCHGVNGVSAISERDLRRLKLRYKDEWRNTAIKTIKEGRSDLGMPSWKDAYNDKQIEELLAFLATIQK